MKWRDVIIGAIASLLVTILGGVAIFYFTKEPDEKKTEKLVYILNQPAQFSGGAEDLAFSSIILSNAGGVAAKNVSLVVSLGRSEIKDLSIRAGNGLREKVRERGPKNLRIVYENFLPQEQVTVNLLLTKSEQPTIDVRSDATLGEKKKVEEESNSRSSKLSPFLEKFIAAIGIGAVAFISFSFFYLRRRGAFIPPTSSAPRSSKNNVGFLLLHNGLTREADAVLNSAVNEGKDYEYTLSNYALCKAAQGDFDQSQKFLKASSFIEGDNHERAVHRFNEALISLLQGDKDNAIRFLKEALSLSPKEIRQYCQKSVLLDVVRTDQKFSDLLKEA